MIVHLLHKFVQSVKIGSPFNLENVRRIRVLGIMLIVLELLIYMGSKIVGWMSNNLLELNDISFRKSFHMDLDFLGNWVFVGLMILVIAEVLKKGVEMQEEQELTI